MVSVSDFEQNFLRGIKMGDKVSTRTDAYTKNFWSKDNSVYNKLDNEGKKEYLQELQEGKTQLPEYKYTKVNNIIRDIICDNTGICAC